MQLWRILTGLAICSSVVIAVEKREQREFDYFLFVRQYAPNFCDFHRCYAGYEPSITDFTIHGLWPDYNDGSYPSFCTNTKFNPSKVSDLLPELETEWPTYAARGGNAFWKHEYEKHGTCSVATFPDEHKYFRGVLDLNVQYNLMRALQAQGITPSVSETYPATDMESAIETMTGVTDSCIVNCKQGEVDEVDICLDKELQPIACPNKRDNRCGNLVLKPLGSQSNISRAA